MFAFFVLAFWVTHVYSMYASGCLLSTLYLIYFLWVYLSIYIYIYIYIYINNIKERNLSPLLEDSP